LIATNNDIQALVNRTNTLPTTLTADADAVVKQVTGTVTGAISSAETLLAQAKQCGATRNRTPRSCRTRSSRRSSSSSASANSTPRLELGDQVRKLTLTQIPSTVSIPLTDTGRREAGDHFTVKFAVGVADKAARVVVTRDVIMYRILWHTDLKANLILAIRRRRPRSAISRPRRRTTSCSKHGSRDHVLWNSLFDPGIGLNLAAQTSTTTTRRSWASACGVRHPRLRHRRLRNTTSRRGKYWFLGCACRCRGRPSTGRRQSRELRTRA